jgi:RNA polymerase sporulation-specific sigma factor
LAETELELIEKHKRIVPIIIRKFFSFRVLSGKLSEQDLYQEGMIALFKAIKTFKEGSGAKLETYASRCIKNRLIDIFRQESASGEHPREIMDSDTGGFNLEDEVDVLEKSEIIKKTLSECTEIERAIFNSYAGGFSYNEMSKVFEVSTKKIDNVIQKIRGKIKAATSD